MASFVEMRCQRLRKNIQFGQDRCLEIGALVAPILHRQDGNIFYADHLSTEDLKKQFAWDKDFDLNNLVDVDFIWDAQKSFKDCVVGDFDYVIASHVGEHVPNLIGWIDQIRQVIKPNGQLRLVFPDGRYSFDMKRAPTRLSDLLATWIKQTYYPETHLVLDFALNKVEDHLVSDMHIRHVSDFNATALPSQFSFSEALDWGRKTLNPHHYEDVHCWVLHLNLFAKLMIPLARHNILNMSCVNSYDIDPPHTYEFIVCMSPEHDVNKRVKSWERLYQSTRKYADPSFSRKEYMTLLSENERLKMELHSMYHSSSWRITAPLRAIMKYLNNRL